MRNKGVTLLEMMIVLAILLIVSLSLPRFQKALHYYQLDSYARVVMMDFQYALRMAQSSGKSVSLCISIDQQTCTQEGDLYNWHQGWIIFYDIKNDFMPNSDLILKRRPNNTVANITHRSDLNIKNAIRLDGKRRFGSTAGTGLPNGSMRMCISKLTPIDLKITIFGEGRLEKQNGQCL
jgi:prepilin-type N-terminal cleavage/methylation domain-containing protein